MAQKKNQMSYQIFLEHKEAEKEFIKLEMPIYCTIEYAIYLKIKNLSLSNLYY